MKTYKLLATLLLLLPATSCIRTSDNNIMEKEKIVTENIMERRSIRKYTSEIPSREILDKILECGINAPNGQNRQSWEIRVVDNPQTMELIKKGMAKGNPGTNRETIYGCFRGAPVMIFIARDTTYDFSAYDCGLLAQNIMLSAWSMGVGSICLGSPVRFINNNQPPCKEVLETLGFSEGYELSLCVGLGYADETPEAKPRIKEKIKYID